MAFFDKNNNKLYISKRHRDVQNIFSKRGQTPLIQAINSVGDNNGDVVYVDNVGAILIETYNPKEMYDSDDFMDYDIEFLNSITIRGLLFKVYFKYPKNRHTDDYAHIDIFYKNYMVANSKVDLDDMTAGTKICCDFNGYGLGKIAATMVRRKLGAKSGAQTPEGFKMLQKIWLDEVRKALASGYYDHALKNNTISRQTIKNILTWLKKLREEGLGYETYLKISKEMGL